MKLHNDPSYGIDPTLSTGRLLDVPQVADVLGCGRTLVYDLLGRGELTRVKIGRLTRVPSSDLDRYVRRQMGGQGSGVTLQPAPRPSGDVPAPTLPF